jgi:hypothetical protein
MSEDDLRRISADVGMWSGDLRTLSERGPHAADLLGRRLAGMGLDVDRLGNASPSVVQDMQRVCAFCESKGRCEHDLDLGGSGLPDHCPNADSLRDLIKAGGAVGD